MQFSRREGGGVRGKFVPLKDFEKYVLKNKF